MRKDLPKSISLIGFAGAPWTLACYMIEGKGSKDFINTRKALWNSNNWFMELIETLSLYVAEKLEIQANAGADLLMIFDSWSHMIPNNFFEDCAINPISNIVQILRDKKIFTPIIGFPFKAGSSIIKYSYETKVDCISLDWSVDLNWANNNINLSKGLVINRVCTLRSENPYYEHADPRVAVHAQRVRNGTHREASKNYT